ncbi:hypothetical protein JL720_12626 [Aureococcus anophagefferens]|nr:hypothetical protein JL720_12626 [Aureococcus anophagefferens]
MLRQLRKKRIALCDVAAAAARSANVPRCSPDGSPALSPAPSEDDEAAAPNAENAAPPADDATAVSCEDRSLSMRRADAEDRSSLSMRRADAEDRPPPLASC